MTYRMTLARDGHHVDLSSLVFSALFYLLTAPFLLLPTTHLSVITSTQRHPPSNKHGPTGRDLVRDRTHARRRGRRQGFYKRC